jgi:hypothetical protein
MKLRATEYALFSDIRASMVSPICAIALRQFSIIASRRLAVYRTPGIAALATIAAIAHDEEGRLE